MSASDENNVANKRCEKKLFAPEKKAVSSLFPPTEHEVLSSGGEDESAAHDQTRVNSYKKEQDVDPHQGTNGFSPIDLPTEHEVLSSGVNGFSSIGGERETAVEETAAPHQNRVNSSEDEEDADDVIPQVQARVYAPRLSDKERLSNVRYFWTLEQTLKAAQDKARLHLDEDPPFLRKYQCEECGVNPTCCLLKFKRQEGPNATCPLSKHALDSMLPTVDQIADACAKEIVYCEDHGDKVDPHRCNRHCKSHHRQLRSPPVYGAALIAASLSSSRRSNKREAILAEIMSGKNKYEAHKCCGGGTYDEDGRVRKPCCYEMFQRGEGKNAKYILKTSIAAIVADIAYPVCVKAKATIDAGFSPEETAKAVVREYEKATVSYAHKQRAFHTWIQLLQVKGMNVHKPAYDSSSEAYVLISEETSEAHDSSSEAYNLSSEETSQMILARMEASLLRSEATSKAIAQEHAVGCHGWWD